MQQQKHHRHCGTLEKDPQMAGLNGTVLHATDSSDAGVRAMELRYRLRDS